MPAVTEPSHTATYRRCGRCRAEFPLEHGADPRTASDWWACDPCAAILLPSRSR